LDRYINNYVEIASQVYKLGKRYDKNSYAGISVFMALDYFRENELNLTADEKVRVLKIVSEQEEVLKLLKNKTPFDEFTQIYRYEEELIRDLVGFASLVYKKELDEEMLQKLDTLENQIKPLPKKKKHSVYILSAPPCSGKSTYIDKYKKSPYLVVSRDFCTEEIGKINGKNNFDEAVELQNSDDDVLEQTNILEDSYFDIAKKYNYDIFVDNVNLSHSKRRWWVDNKRKTHNIKVIMMLKSLDDLVECSQKRSKEENKSISQRVIINKIKDFQIPLKNDGFDKIEFIFKDNLYV